MKRLVDILFSLIGLCLLSLPLAILAVKVYLKMGWPIFFTQLRAGKNGRPFKIIKFRTMMDVRNSEGKLLPDSQRVTKFGLWLRATSLDELPELWNVLIGEMSIVGPRPLLIEYLALYNSHQARRLETLPGITGWAQINGRNGISWEEKFNYDVWYVENHSLALDLKIMFLTLRKVMNSEDISASGEVGMSIFTGSCSNREPVE